MDTTIINSLKIEYDRRQKQAADDLEARKQKAYKLVPRLEEIEREISLTGIKCNKMILFDNDKSNEALLILRKKLKALKEEKSKLLKINGLPDDYLDISFSCPKCRDTGVLADINGLPKYCSCYRQLLLNHSYLMANLNHAEGISFSKFNENYYPDKPDVSKYGIRSSPRENIKIIKKSCMDFVKNFESDKEQNLYFSGPTGVGKTFMASCIAIELMSKGYVVLYQSAPLLFNAISEQRQRFFKEDATQDSIYDQIMKAELLIIDDLGTEPPSAARYADLLTILNSRLNKAGKRPCRTIISTNIDAKYLGDYYDERIVSRIAGSYDMYRFAGEDIRRLKARGYGEP